MLVFDAYLTNEQITNSEFVLNDENWPKVIITRPDLVFGIQETITEEGVRVVLICIEGQEDAFAVITPIETVVKAFQKFHNLTTTFDIFWGNVAQRIN